MKPFEHWEYEEVERTFGIRRLLNLPTLTTWLNANIAHTPTEIIAIDSLKDELFSRVEDWNEDELKFFFISNFIRLINFNKPGKYSAFTQRFLQFTAKNIQNEEIKLRGRVEFMVATGKQKPWQPYFFLHEYKPQLKGTNDPLGQLLVAMYVAQQLNEDKKMPVLGCYVLGKFWQFVVLDCNEYAVSHSFDASQEDIHQIASILKWCKNDIEARIGIKPPL
jgi:hypothetical protein